MMKDSWRDQDYNLGFIQAVKMVLKSAWVDSEAVAQKCYLEKVFLKFLQNSQK